MSDSRVRTWVWVLLALCDAGVLAYGLIILVHPTAMLELGFTSHTGASWNDFQAEEPHHAEYFSLVVRMLGAYNAAFGVLALGIILRPFRAGQPWAWWSLLIGNLLAFGVAMGADLYGGSIGFFEIIEFAMAPLVILALAVAARDFRRSATPRSAGPDRGREQ